MSLTSTEPRAPAGRHSISTTTARFDSTRRLLDDPVLPTLLRLAAPTVALMTLQGLISAGEAAFIGRLGSAALAGASLSFPLVMLMTTLSAGAFGGGVASAVARALGAGRVTDAQQLAGTALTLSTIFGMAFTILMLIEGRTFYTALGAQGPSLDAAVFYSNGLFLGAMPFWIFNAAASILRAGGNANLPATAGAIGGLVTLAVSPLLIFGIGQFTGFGIAGAAGAVVAYNIAMAAVLLRAITSKHAVVRPTLHSLIPQWRSVFEILRISIPSAASTLLTNLTFIVLTSLVAPFGEAATAGYGSGGRLEYLLIPIIFGVGSALVPLIAASDGAGDFQRVQRLTRTGVALATGACTLAGTTVALFPGLWMSLFTSDLTVSSIGTAYLSRVGWAYPFLGLGLSLYFAAQGRGRTLLPLLASGTRLLVAGAGGVVLVQISGGTLESLFNLMAVGLMLYALVMVIVMRRELGITTK